MDPSEDFVNHRIQRHPSDPDARAWRYPIATFADIVKLNLAFIRGRLSSTPFHASPLAADSLTVQDQLVTINQLGLLTVNGQAGVHEYGFVPKTGRWFEAWQKPYVVGFMQRPQLDAFFAALVDLGKHTQAPVRYTAGYMEGGRFRSVANYRTRTVVTIDKDSRSEEGLTRKFFRNYTSIAPAYAEDFTAHLKVLENAHMRNILARCALVTVFMDAYNNQELEQVVTAALQRS